MTRARFRDKIEWVLRRAAGKHVLYIGSVDESADSFRKHEAAHARVQRSAATLVGIYRSDAQVAQLRAAGCDARVGDVEDLHLDRTFDVVVAVDNIEHVSNAGRFVSSMERHVAAGGVLLVSTPNPCSLVRILEVLALGQSRANVNHTCWYTRQVLDQLVRRHGLRVEESVFIDEMHLYHSVRPAVNTRLAARARSFVAVGLNRLACPLLPQLSETAGFVLVRSSASAAA
jgi:SAM-dependent methyltransferase